MPVASTHLPIWEIHSKLLHELRRGNRLVLVAPTGSGKTTQVPQMLLDAGLAELASQAAPAFPTHTRPGKIVVLQPRRVAARTVAARVAWERSGALGGEVGYQIRFEDKLGPATRICFLTEGVFLRWLESNPLLPDIAAVLFDEFHERNLLSDVSLALVKKLQKTRRPDLKIIVMSATLETTAVAEYLQQDSAPEPSAQAQPFPCPILESAGQSFPVTVGYLRYKDARAITEQAASAVETILQSGKPGDILVFMPGAGEISSTINALRAINSPEKLALIPLHGELPPEEQDRAFAPNPLRKVVVSTNVAETSVTIDGVRHVIDSGQARIARFDPERGVGTLFIEEISRASADQRKGRAGRTAPGSCLRLWTESGHLNRPERNTPEIQRSDLAEIVLFLHSLGVRNAATFDWLNQPDPVAVERAENLLRTLGALRPLPPHPGDERPSSGDITPLGRRMLKLPIHPRYARMLLEAAHFDCVPAAALCAALVSGRDLLMRVRRGDQQLAETRELFEASAESDFFTLMRAYHFARNNRFSLEACRRYGIHAQTARQVEQTYHQIMDVARAEGLSRPPREASPGGAGPELDAKPGTLTDDGLLRSIMSGFIDQLCVRRDEGTLNCDLTEHRSGTLMRESVVQTSKLFVAAILREIDNRAGGATTLVGLASAVKREWIPEAAPSEFAISVEHVYDRTHRRVRALRLERFKDLLIHGESADETDPLECGRALAQAYQKGWFELPLFDHEAKQLVIRVNLVSVLFPELGLKPLDQEGVANCLAQRFAGLTLAKEAQAMPVRNALFDFIGPDALNWVNELAPLTIAWPERGKVKLLYLEQGSEIVPPEAQVRLQECFSLKDHPKICDGRLAVKLWLCGPDGKRLESTTDWPAFKWKDYPKIRPVLIKKYHGVAWPAGAHS